MVYQLKFSPSYERDIKRLKRKRRDLRRLKQTLNIVRHGRRLTISYRPHRLRYAAFAGFYECHLAFDWLLVWSYEEDDYLHLIRTGSNVNVCLLLSSL
jgi:mRNA interferase YafQ